MKIIKKGLEARLALKRGIDTVADCVKVTLGPSGKNAVLGRQGIIPIITNDGVSIARNIEMEDPTEELGAMIVKEASSLTDIKVGDGTTTTTVLLQSLVNEVFLMLEDNGSLISKKVDTMKIKKEIDLACEQVVEELKKAAKPVKMKDLYDVALVSVEHEHLAEIIAEVFKKIGVDGFVQVEEGMKTGYEVFKGLEIPAGLTSEYYINNDKGECVIDNTRILVTNQPLDSSKELGEVIMTIAGTEAKGVIIIAPDFSKDLLNRLIQTKLTANFPVVALKLPTFDDTSILVDIATLTKGKLLDKALYAKYEDLVKDIKLENFGSVDKSISTSSKTVIIGGTGDTKPRIDELKAKIKQTESAFDRDRIERRIAYLSGGIAHITVGADSDTERGYLKLKLDDGVNAVQNALREGVVKGGGLALKEIGERIKANILTKTLSAPYNQIQENAGEAFEIPVCVVDPVATTIAALKSACSLAGTLLTTEVTIAYPNSNDTKNKNED